MTTVEATEPMPDCLLCEAKANMRCQPCGHQVLCVNCGARSRRCGVRSCQVSCDLSSKIKQNRKIRLHKFRSMCMCQHSCFCEQFCCFAFLFFAFVGCEHLQWPHVEFVSTIPGMPLGERLPDVLTNA